MACNKKKAHQQRPKDNQFLACFGITSKTASKSSDKKRNKTGGQESWFNFKLCMPKIKIIIIRRRKGKGKGKGSFDAQRVALKACQSIIKLEATKIQQVKINDALITQEETKTTVPVIQSNDQQKQSDDDLQSRRERENQSDEEPSREQRPISTVKVTKDSLVGVLMMVTTLIIMTFWGLICAIICMSAWLYCVPLLRMYKDGHRPNVMGSLKAKIASKLYKKKVMIQGGVHIKDAVS